jgi:hypothetical protein
VASHGARPSRENANDAAVCVERRPAGVAGANPVSAEKLPLQHAVAGGARAPCTRDTKATFGASHACVEAKRVASAVADADVRLARRRRVDSKTRNADVGGCRLDEAEERDIRAAEGRGLGRLHVANGKRST